MPDMTVTHGVCWAPSVRSQRASRLITVFIVHACMHVCVCVCPPVQSMYVSVCVWRGGGTSTR